MPKVDNSDQQELPFVWEKSFWSLHDRLVRHRKLSFQVRVSLNSVRSRSYFRREDGRFFFLKSWVKVNETRKVNGIKQQNRSVWISFSNFSSSHICNCNVIFIPRLPPRRSINNLVSLSAVRVYCKNEFALFSDDLKSHFPTSACSPVKQSADTEAKTLKITLAGYWMNICFLIYGCVFG